MDKFNQIAIVCCLFSLLTACSAIDNLTNKNESAVSKNNIEQIAKKKYTPTLPESILVIEDQQIKTPYKIIAKVHIPNYNDVGIKLQKAVIHDLLQKNAASVGGNAIIGIKETNQETMGKVIRFTS